MNRLTTEKIQQIKAVTSEFAPLAAIEAAKSKIHEGDSYDFYMGLLCALDWASQCFSYFKDTPKFNLWR